MSFNSNFDKEFKRTGRFIFAWFIFVATLSVVLLGALAFVAVHFLSMVW